MSKKKEINPNTVKYMASQFFTREDVAAALEINGVTLDRFLMREFKMSWKQFRAKHAVQRRVKLMEMMYKKAEDGEFRAIDKLCDVYVWPEHKHKIQLSGNEAEPIVTKQKTNYDNLSVEELETLEKITDKLKKDG